MCLGIARILGQRAVDLFLRFGQIAFTQIIDAKL
jgi:hypothetical protein